MILLCAGLMLAAMLANGTRAAKAEPALATGVDFALDASFDPYAVSEHPDRFQKGLAKALEALELKGHMTLQNGQADITGDLMLNGLSAVDFHLSGWEERLSLQTSLFGEKPVLLTMANYMPYLLKVNDYFGTPLQYFGIFTDLYSYKHGILPALETWRALTGGLESRSYTQQETIAMAETLTKALDQDANPAFHFWRRGLLQYVTLDELLNDFLYSLPDWMAELTENGGLTIQVSGQEETWTLGGETVYTLRHENGNTAWQLDIPEWEGFQLSGEGVFEETDAGLNVDMKWNLFESGTLYGFARINAAGLPDGRQLQGSSSISVSLGGEGLGVEKTYMAALTWNQQQQNGKTILTGQLGLLNPETGKRILNLNANITWADTQESFEPRTAENIIGIDFFCMNDITIKEFFHDAKGPLIRSAAPFLVELPAGFWNGVVDWMDNNGILLTLMNGLKGSAE